MKAAVLYGPNDLRVEETPRPPCPSGGAVVRLAGSMICGSDVKIFKNGHPAIRPPQIIGHENCGTIVELDQELAGLAVGDRVVVQPSIACGTCRTCRRGLFNICENLKALSLHYPGVFAEYVALPEQALKMGNLIKVPHVLSDAEACLSEPLGCVLNGQDLLSLRAGEEVLVVGAGPIGILHAELAKVSGAGRIIMAEISPLKLEMAKRFGYTDYIDTRNSNLVEEVMRLTDKRGVDVAIVAAPAKEVMEQTVGALAFRGRLSLFASLPKDQAAITIDSRAVHYKELAVIGASSSSVALMQRALDILASGAIHTQGLITHQLPLGQIIAGMDLCLKGEALKVYLNPLEA